MSSAVCKPIPTYYLPHLVQSYRVDFKTRHGLSSSTRHNHNTTQQQQHTNLATSKYVCLFYKADILLSRTQDKEYLSPIIREIEKELKERQDLDNLVVKRK